MKSYLTIICVLIITSVSAQNYKIGVRSGVNYSTFMGPLESQINEEYGFSGGFHFGFNFTYYFIENFGLRGELLYIRNGTKQNFNGETFYITKITESGTNDIEWGTRIQSLDMSNAYFSLPITAHYQLNKKWEIFTGVNFNFILAPSAGGLIDFDSKKCTEDANGVITCENDDGFFFLQTLSYDYNSDLAGGFTTGTAINPIIDIDGQKVTLPSSIGAYYYYDSGDDSYYAQTSGSLINKFDLGLTAGVNFFINRGFYTGLRLDYGFRDITNNQLDYSNAELNADDSFIFREDKDTHLGIQASVGFRF